MHKIDDRPVQIEVPPAHLFALRDWLAAEDPLRGRVIPLTAAPKQGQMGGAVEILTVALGSSGAATVLARSLCTWLIHRRADVTITITASGGQRVHVDVKRASDPESVIREVGALIDDDPE
ncbi:effector-associated constant component EACC1 [Nocardia sp. NPDC003482]